MSDSPKTEAERRSQHAFSNQALFGLLLLLAISVLVASEARRWIPDQKVLGPRWVTVRYDPFRLDPTGFPPLRLAGSWQVSVDDPRFGGISALAVDGPELLALTDSGAIVRLPRPGGGAALAQVEELPNGPGSPRFKRRRDSEALVRDPAGRGWWVAFEQRHELWLYDEAFTRALERIRLGTERWPTNAGIEALASGNGALLLVPEGGRSVLRLRGSRLEHMRLQGRNGPIADAATLPGGNHLLVERKMTARGFANNLVVLKQVAGAYRKDARLPLEVGPLDNVEALAAESLPSGGIRLWLMTDDNRQRPLRTLLIALDLPNPEE